MSTHDMTIAADLAARRRISATLAMIALVTLLALISLGTGPVRLSPLAVVEALFGGGSDVSQVIVREIRLPRSSLAGSATALVMNLAANPFLVLEIAFWLLGSLEDRSFQHVALALPFIIAGAAILLSQRSAFRALTLGEETAQSLGVDVARLRL